MADVGDTFLPLAGWATVAASHKRVSIEFKWAETEADLYAERWQFARVHLGVEQARDLAHSLIEQAAISLQRARPQ